MQSSKGGAAGSKGGAADRVPRSQAQARSALRTALVFFAAAAVAAGVGGSRWLVLHLFLAGGVVQAISGVSLMLTVTWSAAPAPPDRGAVAQRWAVAVGAAGVAVGRAADLPVAVVGAAGTLYLTGLVLLGVLLVTTIRRGTERRFDVAVASYVTALAAGVGGVGVGIAMASGTPTAHLRSAHVTLNVLGLVGLVVAGTMPFFAATVGRSRMAPQATPRRLAATLAGHAAVLVLAVAGLVTDHDAMASVGLVLYAVAIGRVLTLLPRPTRRQWEWSGPRLAGLWLGGGWWALAVVASAVDASEGRVVLGGRWLLVLVVVGIGQIVWGSFAYLLPMLRGGGHEKLSEGFAATRSWIGLVAVNLAGLALALDAPSVVAAVALTVWLVDAAWRTARVGTRPALRPVPPSG